MEAHGGYTFCGTAALVILGKEHMLDLKGLLVSKEKHSDCITQQRNISRYKQKHKDVTKTSVIEGRKRANIQIVKLQSRSLSSCHPTVTALLHVFK